MRANITFNEITNELHNIFSDDKSAAAYMADSFGPQYIGLCGWAGAMSPANRAAFVATFGRDVTDRAEAEARARVAEYRAAVESSTYHAAELEADAWQAAYGDPEKSQNQEADEWGRTAETQAINAALVVVPAHVMRDFGFIADSGEIVTNPGRAALLHPSRGFVCMPDDGGTPYTPAGGADALAEILQAGGFLNFDGFRFVWPIEHDADSIRRVLAAYGVCEKSQTQDTMRVEAQREEVRDWYMFQYPTDEEGANIQAGATFADIMANPARVYGYIPADSIIRERVFRETANRYGVDYSEIYSRWLDGGEDSPAPSYGEPEKSPVPFHLADIYQRAKAKCAEAVALFHCGDWFTAYGEDADRVADAVGIIITTTRDGFRKASFPFVALDTYLPRMVRQGMKVCICDAPRQAEPSRQEKVAQEV